MNFVGASVNSIVADTPSNPSACVGVSRMSFHDQGVTEDLSTGNYIPPDDGV